MYLEKKILTFNLSNLQKFIKGVDKATALLIFKYLLTNSIFLNRVLLRKQVQIESSFVWFFEVILEGLGYKLSKESYNNEVFINFDLGFSHGVSLKIPANIKIIIRKKRILLYSSDKVNLGNFVIKLLKLKPQNSYKNLGFYIPYNKKVLKKINVLK